MKHLHLSAALRVHLGLQQHSCLLVATASIFAKARLNSMRSAGTAFSDIRLSSLPATVPEKVSALKTYKSNYQGDLLVALWLATGCGPSKERNGGLDGGTARVIKHLSESHPFQESPPRRAPRCKSHMPVSKWRRAVEQPKLPQCCKPYLVT
eukprot:4845562-Amphidinium_carterae.1